MFVVQSIKQLNRWRYVSLWRISNLLTFSLIVLHLELKIRLQRVSWIDFDSVSTATFCAAACLFSSTHFFFFEIADLLVTVFVGRNLYTYRVCWLFLQLFCVRWLRTTLFACCWKRAFVNWFSFALCNVPSHRKFSVRYWSHVIHSKM